MSNDDMISVLPYIELADFDGNGNEIYHGWAIPGSATSDPVWKIIKLEYDGNGNRVSKKYVVVSDQYGVFFKSVWDDRAGLTYG